MAHSSNGDLLLILGKILLVATLLCALFLWVGMVAEIRVLIDTAGALLVLLVGILLLLGAGWLRRVPKPSPKEIQALL